MDDLISRQAAVDKVRELFALGECHCDEYSIVGMLNSLPSQDAIGELVDIAIEILAKYKAAEMSVIWEYSTTINEDFKALEAEFVDYVEKIGALFPESFWEGRWTSKS